jgi:hypothetical protein
MINLEEDDDTDRFVVDKVDDDGQPINGIVSSIFAVSRLRMIYQTNPRCLVL